MPRRRHPHGIAQQIGRRIRALRAEQGLTAEKLAYQSEIKSKGFLSDIESGHALPSMETLAKIADHLEVDLLDLLTVPEDGGRHLLFERSRWATAGAIQQATKLLMASDSAGNLEPRQEVARFTQLICYPSLQVAAGFGQPAAPISPEGSFVRLPGEFDTTHCFVVRAHGVSMRGPRQCISAGDWLVLRWTRVSLGAVRGEVALIARRDGQDDQTLHVKRVVHRRGTWWLASDNPETPDVPASQEDEVLAQLVMSVSPEQLAPEVGSSWKQQDIGRGFGLSVSPKAGWSRIEGHLFGLITSTSLSEAELEPPKPLQLAVAETAYILHRTAVRSPYRYMGVAQQGGRRLQLSIP